MSGQMRFALPSAVTQTWHIAERRNRARFQRCGERNRTKTFIECSSDWQACSRPRAATGYTITQACSRTRLNKPTHWSATSSQR
jgi:hypothetical protein